MNAVMRSLALRPRLLLLLASALCVVGCCCPAMPEGSPRDWHEFSSQDGNFRISFPLAPRHSTSDDGLEQRYSAETHRGDVVFRATYELNTTYHSGPYERMKLVIDQMQGFDASRRELNLQGMPGAEGSYTIRRDGEEIRIRHRLYQNGTTAYQVMVVAGKRQDVRKEAERFFRSFRLLNP